MTRSRIARLGLAVIVLIVSTLMVPSITGAQSFDFTTGRIGGERVSVTTKRRNYND